MALIDPLLADVLANPGDDAPRRVWADRLIERGDPRGEFINLQCEIARLGPDHPDAWHLAARASEIDRRDWSRGFHVEWARGFAEKLKIVGWRPDPQRLAALSALFAEEPIRELDISDLVAGTARDIAAIPGFERLDRLVAWGCHHEAVGALLAGVPRLRSLRLLPSSSWPDIGLAAAAALPCLERLEIWRGPDLRPNLWTLRSHETDLKPLEEPGGWPALVDLEITGARTDFRSLLAARGGRLRRFRTTAQVGEGAFRFLGESLESVEMRIVVPGELRSFASMRLPALRRATFHVWNGVLDGAAATALAALKLDQLRLVVGYDAEEPAPPDLTREVATLRDAFGDRVQVEVVHVYAEWPPY